MNRRPPEQMFRPPELSDLDRARQEEAEQSAGPAMRKLELEHGWTRFCFEVSRWTWCYGWEQRENQYQWTVFCWHVSRWVMAWDVDRKFPDALKGDK